MSSATYSATAFSACPWEVMQSFRHDVWAVYLALHHFGWRSKEGCWASVKTIAGMSGLAQQTVRRAIKQLRDSGWIVSKERPGGTTVHYVHLERHQEAIKRQTGSRQQAQNPDPEAQSLEEPLSKMEGVEAVPLSKTEGVPLSKMTAPPLSKMTDEQDPLTTKSQLTRRTAITPPLPPHEGGDGLTAVDRSDDWTGDVNVSVVEQPEQPSAIVPVKATKKSNKRSASPTAEEAARLMAVWNENRPAGWGALTCINQKRWEVAMGFAKDLGGMEAFLDALPIALANAGQDRFWGGPGHDWNSFMGYGAKTGKGHFLRFLEQEAPRVPTTNPDGSLSFLGTILQAQNNPTPQFF
jgi:DNA-binding MarR family transcriptional regulator